MFLDNLESTGVLTDQTSTGTGTTAVLNSAGVPSPEQLAEFQAVFEKYTNVIGDLAGTYVNYVNKILGALDCWGASWDPARAKKFVQETTSEGAQSLIRMLEVYPNESQIEVINSWFIAYHDSYKMNIAYVEQGGAKDCTRRSLLALIRAMELSYAEFMSVVVDVYTSMGYECTLYDIHNDDNEGKWRQPHLIKQIRVRYVGRVAGTVKRFSWSIFWMLVPVTIVVAIVRYLTGSNVGRKVKRKSKRNKVKIKIKNRNVNKN
ncbi:hypothetical protein [Zhouia amylolytica]|uniref:hypothetical protein n=1 Tax=Zhouia amylolytica TaxID=376730 RepID=UPI0020CD0262|nr:hypothetical protein [Zhouia amylolytica]MCQ0113033.1 hypothetical protein [Zhouia amylolytica]